LREREKGFEIYQGEIKPKQHARLPRIALIFFEPSPVPCRLVCHGSVENRARTSIRRQSKADGCFADLSAQGAEFAQ
jgi:hypothetical protein